MGGSGIPNHYVGDLLYTIGMSGRSRVRTSAKGSFFAGMGLWCLIWAALFKADEIAELGGFQHWVSKDQCLRWISKHRSTTLIGTELVNYTHTGLDPLGVTFALGGTLVNALVIFLLLPMRDRAKRGGELLNL